MLGGWQIFDIFAGRRMTSVMMVIAVRISNGMMSTRLIVLQLIIMVLLQGRVEVLLLVCPNELSVDVNIQKQHE
jgi:hypothetical protein